MESAATVLAVVMTIFWMGFRQREAARPLSPRRILIPPLGMSTGTFMYIVPAFRPAPTQLLEALGAGAICGAILVATTKLELRERSVYLRRSRAIMYVLLALIAVRWIARLWLRQTVPFQQLSGMFFLLALIMILEWRAAMFVSYRRLAASARGGNSGTMQ
jgi:membrane protein CcdC involved in cytochrome C biogenesis